MDMITNIYTKHLELCKIPQKDIIYPN